MIESTKPTAIKNAFAWLIIRFVQLCLRVFNRISGKDSRNKENYYLARFFQKVFKKYMIRVKYVNPIDKTKRVIMRLNICLNTQQLIFRAKNTYENDEVQMIAIGMACTNHFFDIGANIGVFSLAVAQAFPAKKIFAFEPVSDIFVGLKTNIALNNLGYCQPLQAAVSDEPGKAVFYFNPFNDGAGTLAASHQYKSGGVQESVEKYQNDHPDFLPTTEVEVYRLDDLVLDPSVLKIDVEGAEIKVLRSAEQAILRGLIVLMVIEVDQETVKEVIEYLTRFGYETFSVFHGLPIKDVDQYPPHAWNLVSVRKNSPALGAVVARLQSVRAKRILMEKT